MIVVEAKKQVESVAFASRIGPFRQTRFTSNSSRGSTIRIFVRERGAFCWIVD